MAEFSAQELIVKAARRAVSDKLSTYYKKLIDEDLFDDINLGYGNDNAIVLDILKELKGKTDNILDTKNGKLNYCFYTVNFQESITPSQIVEVMNEFTSNSSYLSKSEFIWSIEQRSEVLGEEFGFHVHIVFTKDKYPPSKLQRAFKGKFFDKYVGNPSCLDYKYLECPRKKIKYILGIKDEAEKMAKVAIDKVWRLSEGFQQSYLQGENFKKIVDEVMAEEVRTGLPDLPCFRERIEFI